MPNGNLYAWDGNSLATTEAAARHARSARRPTPIRAELIRRSAPATTRPPTPPSRRSICKRRREPRTYFYNARGVQEKYFVSGNGSNPAGGGYYILLPNGNLYAWIGNSWPRRCKAAPAATLPHHLLQNTRLTARAARPPAP